MCFPLRFEMGAFAIVAPFGVIAAWAERAEALLAQQPENINLFATYQR